MANQTCTRCGKIFEKKDQSIGNICPDCKAGKSTKNFKLWKYILFVGAILIVALISKCMGVEIK